jgi:hypothetical protein
MTIRFFTVTLILHICLFSNAFGDSTPPPSVSDTISVQPTLDRDPIQQIKIGIFIAEFEKTTLLKIRETVGIGSIAHSGDASSSQYWLCYSLPGQRIWLISHGEMGGSDHQLTQVHVISINSSSEPNSGCPALPIQFQPLHFEFGWIGTDQQSLVKALGQPSGKEGDTHIYFYFDQKSRIHRGKQVNWYVLGYVAVTFLDDKIISIYASHVTSS